MLSWASGSSWARWNELIVGSMVSSSPLTTRTGWRTVGRLAAEPPCSHLASAVTWATTASFVIGASRPSALVQAPEEGVRGGLAGGGGGEEQEVLGVLALRGCLLDRVLQHRVGRPGPASPAGEVPARMMRRTRSGRWSDHLGDHAAERVAQQVDRCESEGLHERHRICGHGLDGVWGGAAGASDAPEVDQDDAALGGEAVDHGRVPVVEDPGEMVQEHQRDALGGTELPVGEGSAADLDGPGDGVVVCRRHGRALFSRVRAGAVQYGIATVI